MPPVAARPLDQIVTFLCNNISLLQKKQILAGFDGFIDTIVKPVRKYGAKGECEYFDSIAEFGAFIGGHSHKSKSIQYEVLQKRPGGNLANFTAALDALSLSTTAIGMFSNEAGVIDPFFENLGEKRYSYHKAGSAIAFEFNDGKVFFSPANVPDIQHDEKMFLRIENVFPDFCKAIASADINAFLNWSELPFAHDLWNDVFSNAISTAEKDKTRFVFFDLCDTGAKRYSEIEEVVSLIKKTGERRGTILSLNKNEALDLSGKMGDQNQNMEETAEHLFERLCLDELVIHQHTESLGVSTLGGMVTEPCVFNKKPKISTGAGDHFNAAYCCATLAALPIVEKLRFANAYSAAYVAKGVSPGLRYFSKRRSNSGSVT